MPFLQHLVGIGRSAANRSMCGGTERVTPLPSSPSSSSSMEEDSAAAIGQTGNPGSTNCQTTDATVGCFSSLLEFAANNDVEAIKKSLSQNTDGIVDEIGLWYCRRKGSCQMVLEHRTPLMVAATYGSLDVLRFILSLSRVDVNRFCGSDKATALHCAASGGSTDAVEAVKLLVDAGADVRAKDANGLRPADVIAVSPKLTGVGMVLEELLGVSTIVDGSAHHRVLSVSTRASNFHSPPLSSSPDEDGSPSSDSTSSPMTREHASTGVPPEKKEYPVDPSIPDIKNSIYSTDEFRMFSFKVRPCSRAYSHDWTECPFVHPGENARRRDPRKYHYSCVPCPDFRKGACRRGDLCEYAHGVFECWLHPAQYRTRLCKDGIGCARRVCFFAHTSEELRPLFMSTGSAVPSPRSSMDMAAAMSLLSGSPSSVMSMSPSANGHSSLNWPQPNVPTLHLPGSNLQSSRLRSSLSARDMPADDLLMLQDYDSQQLLNEFCFSSQNRLSASNRQVRTNSLVPSNLDDLFSAEVASPRYSSDQGSMFSPSHKSSILSQFQQQQQNLLSPSNANIFPTKAMESQQIAAVSSLLHQASLGISSPGRMSPRGMEPISPLSSRASIFAQREKQQQQLRSLSSRELFSGSLEKQGSPANPLWSNSKWGSPSGMLDWGVNGDELGQLKRSSSFELRSNGDEPDVSWVHSLVRESPMDAEGKNLELSITGSVGPSASGCTGEATDLISHIEETNESAVRGDLLCQMLGKAKKLYGAS